MRQPDPLHPLLKPYARALRTRYPGQDIKLPDPVLPIGKSAPVLIGKASAT